MFSKEPVKSLFGEDRQSGKDRLAAIEVWLQENGFTTRATRVDFVLNGMQVEKIGVTDISEVGGWHVSEATEANRCVDRVVTDFSELKTMLNGAKTLILDALAIIEGSGKAKGFLGFLRSSKPDPVQVRTEVKAKLDEAASQYRQLAKTHIRPFLEGLSGAKQILNKILEDLDNTINSLNYVIAKNPEQSVQDLAYKRKEMFTKSLALMQMNIGQVQQMEKALSDNDSFVDELGMTIIPLVENVMRTAVINGSDGLEDISKALKGIL